MIEGFAILVFVGVIWWMVRKAREGGDTLVTGHPKAQKIRPGTELKRTVKRSANPRDQQLAALRKHWAAVGKNQIEVPAWYGEPMSDAQHRRLMADGWSFKQRELTKGQASDVIGLGEPPEPVQEEILKFFKIPKRDAPNQTFARIRIAELKSDPEQWGRWMQRPATPSQRELYRWLGEKPPKGLTSEQASAFLAAASAELDEEKEDAFASLDGILEELDDPEFRKDLEIKKIPIGVIRESIEQLEKEGTPLAEMTADEVADKAIEIRPNLQRG
jgi:hypothetical protein